MRQAVISSALFQSKKLKISATTEDIPRRESPLTVAARILTTGSRIPRFTAFVQVVGGIATGPSNIIHIFRKRVSETLKNDHTVVTNCLLPFSLMIASSGYRVELLSIYAYFAELIIENKF
jgi:hypothetical protein